MVVLLVQRLSGRWVPLTACTACCRDRTCGATLCGPFAGPCRGRILHR